MKQILKTVALLALCYAVPAQAITTDDVIGLTRADASDAIILSKIDADGTVFHLTVNDILRLKEAGVSDTVITYMINSGKNEAAAEVSQPVPEEPVAEENVPQSYDASQGYGDAYAGYTSGSGGFGISFGYYYPHWPGYLYSYYYDPFYWGSRPYYWCGYAPYPYWGYYSWQPWYSYSYTDTYYAGCFRSYPRSYWGGRHHDRGYDNARADGRHVGGRGAPARDGRNVKQPRDGSGSSFAEAMGGVKTKVRLPSKSPGVTVTRPAKPAYGGNIGKVRPPTGGKVPISRPDTSVKRPTPPSDGGKVSPPSRGAPTPRPQAPKVNKSPSPKPPPARVAPAPAPKTKAPVNGGGGRSTKTKSKGGG